MGRPRKGTANSSQVRKKKKRQQKHVGRKAIRDDVRVLKDQGMSYAKIARVLRKRGEKISKSTVRRQCMWNGEKKEKEYSPTSIAKSDHARVKSLIRLLYETDGHRTTAQAQKAIEDNLGLRVSKSVISLWREEMGFRIMRARYGFAVRLVNRSIRLAFALEKLRTNEQFMMHIFSDEMVLQLSQHPSTQPKRILIWAAISWRGASNMVILSGETVDSIVYQRILNSALVPFVRNVYGPAAIFVQDSAPCHVSKTSKRYLKNKGIQCEAFPPESPDANPIELI